MANPLATSSTSLSTASSGKVVFKTQSGLKIAVGDRLRATSAGTPADWMEGAVTDYADDPSDGLAVLAVTVDKGNGSATHADWGIDLAPPAAAAKDTGPVATVTPTETVVGTPATSVTAVQIPRKGTLTVAVIETKSAPNGSTWNSATLPKDAAVLDQVEVYCVGGPAVTLFPNEKESIGAHRVGEPIDIGPSKGVAFRKVSPVLWLIS